MKTRSVRSIPFLATITAAALVTPCGKKATMTMPHFTQGDKIPNSLHINL